MSSFKQFSGFTLIELMITLVIGSILITVAVPSFSTFTKNNRITTQTNDLITDINFARSEAIKRDSRVILCRSANPTAATPACGGTANTWTTGWLLFASGDADSTYTAGTDTLIRVGQVNNKGVTIKTNSTSNNNLEFNGDGTTNEGGGTAMFAICDDRGTAHGNQIQVKPTGRPRLISPVPNSCSSPS